MVLFRKSTFLPCGFLANQKRKDHFLIFWIEKNKFLDRKEKFQNVRKIEFFIGVSPCFLSDNLALYLAGFLGKPRKKRSFF